MTEGLSDDAIRELEAEPPARIEKLDEDPADVYPDMDTCDERAAAPLHETTWIMNPDPDPMIDCPSCAYPETMCQCGNDTAEYVPPSKRDPDIEPPRDQSMSPTDRAAIDEILEESNQCPDCEGTQDKHGPACVNDPTDRAASDEILGEANGTEAARRQWQGNVRAPEFGPDEADIEQVMDTRPNPPGTIVIGSVAGAEAAFEFDSLRDPQQKSDFKKGAETDPDAEMPEKLAWNLIPMDEMEEVVRAMMDGSHSYQFSDHYQDPPNYMKCPEPLMYYNAAMRHLQAWKRGELQDSRSGLHPLAHAAASCLILMCLDYKKR